MATADQKRKNKVKLVTTYFFKKKSCEFESWKIQVEAELEHKSGSIKIQMQKIWINLNPDKSAF